MNVTTTPPGPSLADEYSEFLATNYVGIAGYVVLVYDQMLTFDDEVKYIWQRQKKLVAWLFLLNRYIMPLAFIVNIHAYTSPLWTPAVCKRFVKYEGATTVLGLAIASLMMAVRVSAIYHGNRFVLALMTFAYLAVLGVDSWLLSTAGPVPHPAIIHGCTMQFGATQQIGDWASAYAWIHLSYDTLVVILVIIRARMISRVKISGQSKLVTTLIKDGLIYYSVILASGLVLVIMIVKAPPGIKYISAQLQQLITVTMMSRITLNLRKYIAFPGTTENSFTTVTDLEFRMSPQHEYIPMKNISPLPRVVRKRSGRLDAGLDSGFSMD